MTIHCHPITGEPLNTIEVKHKSITTVTAAVTIHLLRNEGVAIHDIANQFGTNPARINAVVHHKAFKGSVYVAQQIEEELTDSSPDTLRRRIISDGEITDRIRTLMDDVIKNPDLMSKLK